MSDNEIKPNDLAGLTESQQHEIMVRWFHENYENPAERTPYESAEGGYIWIWGGPYDAREEIDEYFHEYAIDSAIDSAVDEIQQDGLFEWAPAEEPGDYDEYLIDAISGITEAHHNFTDSILDIEKLLKTDINSEVACNFYRLLYVNIITALETFLSDAFVTHVMGDKEVFRKFVKSNPDFQKQQLPLSQILEEAEKLESTVKKYLVEIVWHNLSKVSKMYRNTLGVKFPHDLGDIYRAILQRHDIVHRNGKNKDGEELIVSKQDVLELISQVESLANEIDSQLDQNDL